MAQLIDLIPRTFSGCRRLLEDLRGATTFTLTDGGGAPVTIGEGEIRELVRLVENQIGEKTPAPEAKAAPAKKQTRKTAKR